MKKVEKEAIRKLVEIGAELTRAEDRNTGEKRTGWWLDGVYLAESNQPCIALEAVNG